MEIEMAGRKTELAAYLGTQYFINLRRPRTENELRALIYQLEALSHPATLTPVGLSYKPPSEAAVESTS